MTLREKLRADYEALLGGEGERLGRLLLEELRFRPEETFEEKSWLEQKAWMDEGLASERLR